MNLAKRAAVGLTAAAFLTVPLAACSSGSSSGDSSKPVAQVNNLSKGKMTQVTLNKGFTDALTALKLTPGIVGTAKLDGTTGVATFPITGGNVTYYKPGSVNPFVQGDIQHDGSGLSLTAGATKVELTNFDIDPGASKLYGRVSVNGKVAVAKAYLFNLDGTTLKALQTPTADTAVLEGTKVEMSPDAAGLLNQTFKTSAVKAGLVVGIAKITVATK
ncbi:MAG: hypothetical protein M3140_09870 [Actinomycetota bacterium]|nr:hypothetical protein [Actinomycetota bacterium]